MDVVELTTSKDVVFTYVLNILALLNGTLSVGLAA